MVWEIEEEVRSDRMTSVSVFYIPEQFFTCNLFLQGGENRGFLFHPALSLSYGL